MDKDNRIEVANYLRDLAAGKVKRKGRHGICHHVMSEFGTGVEDYLHATMNRWPEHSGSILYPVPHPTVKPSDAYAVTFNQWDRRTNYGKARCRLALWLAEELEK